jgi:hypothetical protein
MQGKPGFKPRFLQASPDATVPAYMDADTEVAPISKG